MAPGADVACPVCGYVDPAGFSAEPPPNAEVEPELALKGPLGRALGLPRGKAMLLHGGPGTGKSTLAMLAMPGAPILSTEQDLDVIVAYRRRLDLPSTPAAELVVDDDGQPTDIRVAGPVEELVVDSVSMAPCDPVRLVEFVVGWCAARDCRAILVIHETKDETAAGPQRIGHACHAVVQLHRAQLGRTITVHKRRSGTSGHMVPFRLEEDTSEPRYYSIEGERGRYRLIEHPARAAEYNAPLLAWEKGKLDALPRPPLAVAARTSRLSPTGFLAPADIAARREFAAGFGLELWEP